MRIIQKARFFIIILFSFIYPAIASEGLSYDLEPILVKKAKPHPFKTYSLDYRQFNNLGFSSAPEALGVLPLDLQSRCLKGGIQADFSLRGSTFQGVLVLIDGQRVNDPQTGHHNSDIPLTAEDIERIEVVPGAGSSMFGPDSIGGAVNIFIKKPGEGKIILESSLGSHKSWSGIFSASEKKDNFGIRFSLENRESGGFYEDTDFKKTTATLSSSLDIPAGSADVNLGYQEKEFGAYDFYTPKSDYLSKEWTEVYFLSSGLSLDRGGFTIKPNFLWRRHYDKFMLDKTQVRSRYLNHHRTDIYTPNIYIASQLGLLGRAGLGAEYSQEDINSTNLGKHNRKHKSVFIDDSKDLTQALSLGLAGRYDDFESFGQVYTGSVNFSYNLSSGHRFNLGVSRNMRVPSFTELYYSDPTTLADSGLCQESAVNYQAGYDYKKETFSFGAAVFFRQEQDMIDWVKRSSAQAKWQVENITAAGVSGAENYLEWKINPRFHLKANYAYVNKRIDDAGPIYKYGPNYIKHLVNTWLDFELPFGIQGIGLTYKKKPLRRGWCLLGARLSYELTPQAKIFLNVTNLLNVEYQEIEGIPQPGRWLEAGVRFQW